MRARWMVLVPVWLLGAGCDGSGSEEHATTRVAPASDVAETSQAAIAIPVNALIVNPATKPVNSTIIGTVNTVT